MGVWGVGQVVPAVAVGLGVSDRDDAEVARANWVLTATAPASRTRSARLSTPRRAGSFNPLRLPRYTNRPRH
jgi:hypothetical protein